jgi:hypothetical protein
MNKENLKATTWETIAWTIIFLFVALLGVNAIFE